MKQLFTESDLYISVCAFLSVIAVQTFQRWKHEVTVQIDEYAKTFLSDGYVIINSSIPIAEKKRAWENILSKEMTLHWKSQNFDITSRDTWPTTKNCYHLTNTKHINGLPRIFSSNFMVQSILAYIFDSSFKTIHFGSQTHWKLKLLINPFWVLGDIFINKKMIEFSGTDQSWHIVNVPHPKRLFKAGTPKESSAHIDAGEDNIFHSEGIPGCKDLQLTNQERMLGMLFNQLAVVFYCETPGTLGSEEGATGFFRGSHAMITHTLLQLLSSRLVENVPWDAFMKMTKSVGSKLVDSVLIQEKLNDDEVVLAFGTMMHTSMEAVKLMNGNVRTICNCKVNIAESTRKSNLATVEALRLLPRDSMIWNFTSSPLSFTEPKSLPKTIKGVQYIKEEILKAMRNINSELKF